MVLIKFPVLSYNTHIMWVLHHHQLIIIENSVTSHILNNNQEKDYQGGGHFQDHDFSFSDNIQKFVFYHKREKKYLKNLITAEYVSVRSDLL